MSDSQPAAPYSPPPPPLSDNLRSILSLVIFIHLFCVCCVLASNARRSALQGRLVSIFGIYTKTFNFDPDFTPYHLTRGVTSDDSAIVVYLYKDYLADPTKTPATVQLRLPDRGSKWLGERRRYFSLGSLVHSYSQPDNEQEDITAGIAKAVATGLMHEHQCRKAVVEIVTRMSQPLDPGLLMPGFPPDNPTAAPYDIRGYSAEVWIDDDGNVTATKRTATGENAPRAEAG